MPQNPTATTRRFLAHPPQPPSEPTSTLVLTSPTGHFVDIRLLQSHLPSLTPTTTPLPLPLVHPSLVTEHKTPQNFSALNWAFAGTVTSTPLSSPPEGKSEKCKWHHAISSAQLDPSGVVDEGVCTPRTDIGVDGEEHIWELERGVDEGGRGYEEGWYSLPTMINVAETEIDATEGGVILRPARLGEIERKGRERCVVLEFGEMGMKGMAIRVGDWVQGILRGAGGGEDFYAARWVRGERGFMVVGEVGDLETSTRKALRDGMWKAAEGMAKVDLQGIGWRIVEQTSING